MFLPVVFVHPLRVQQMRHMTIAVSLAFFVLAALAVHQDLKVDLWEKVAFLAIAAYFLALPLLRHSPWSDD